MTRTELERKSRRNQWIVGGVLMLIMLFSTLGYALNYETKTTTEVVDYKGIKFIKSDSYWNFNSQGQSLITRYNPEETKNISLIGININLNDYKNKPLYFVGNFQETNNELGRNINTFVLRMQDACLEGENCTSDFPVKSCSEDNVIVIKEPYEKIKESVYKNEKCIFITANLENQTRFADAVLFKILGI
ncbi:MAG: hypothetical protein AABX54_00780 [Nanoarchaeota archaeon]